MRWGATERRRTCSKAPFDPHRGAAGRLRRDLGEQRVDVLGDAEVDLDAGLEGGDERERATALGLGGVHGAVLGGTVENPVGEHELAIERVERAEPQVAAAGELGDGHVTVVGTVQ